MYSNDIKEIENIITDYFNGMYFGDISKLEKSFHKGAYLYGDISGVDYLKNVPEYIEGVKNRKSPKTLGEGFKMRIIGIDVLGKVATAKLYVPMLGYKYHDFLSLVKIHEEWKIVNKLFAHVE